MSVKKVTVKCEDNDDDDDDEEEEEEEGEGEEEEGEKEEGETKGLQWIYQYAIKTLCYVVGLAKW